MTVTIFPSQPAGTIAAPPSKSMSHRLLLCAGLAQGESSIRGIVPSEDVCATLDCLRALGASVALDGGTARVRGCDPAKAGPAVLPCRESGSTLRFFAPLGALSGRETVLEGAPRLLRRPLDVYEMLFRERGLRFALAPDRLTLCGPLPAGEYELPGDVSSQFVSGLLFALPLLGSDSALRLRPPVESRAYIDMTVAALRCFGVTAAWRDELTISVPGGQRYRARDAAVEGDWSNAAPFFALGVDVTGLDADSLQGDRICTEHFAAMERGKATLDLSDCPDLGPLLMACAALRRGARFTGTRRLRFKESDRGAAMAEELAKFGVSAAVGEDEITVSAGAKAPVSALSGHGDHRVVMALAVLCARTGGTITGAECVNKSFPDFFEQLQRVGVQLRTDGE